MSKKFLLKINEKNIFIGKVILIISGYLYILFGVKAERITISLFFFIIFLGLEGYFFIKKEEKGQFFWNVFLIFLLIDGIVFFSIKPIIYFGGMFLLNKIIESILYRGKDCLENDIKNIVNINEFFTYGIFFISIIESPVCLSSYKGIFNNPNGLGILAGFGIILAINNFFYKKKLFLNFFKISISVYFLLISSCRSALLGVLFSITILTIIFLFEKETLEKKIKKIVKTLASVIIIFGVVLQSKYFDLFQRKMLVLLERNDISNGRFEIWNAVLNNVKLLNNGNGFLLLKGTPTHNTYLGLCDNFGLITGICFFIYDMYII